MRFCYSLLLLDRALQHNCPFLWYGLYDTEREVIKELISMSLAAKEA
jgi:hypothetical protein